MMWLTFFAVAAMAGRACCCSNFMMSNDYKLSVRTIKTYRIAPFLLPFPPSHHLGPQMICSKVRTMDLGGDDITWIIGTSPRGTKLQGRQTTPTSTKGFVAITPQVAGVDAGGMSLAGINEAGVTYVHFPFVSVSGCSVPPPLPHTHTRTRTLPPSHARGAPVRACIDALRLTKPVSSARGAASCGLSRTHRCDSQTLINTEYSNLTHTAADLGASYFCQWVLATFSNAAHVREVRPFL